MWFPIKSSLGQIPGVLWSINPPQHCRWFPSQGQSGACGGQGGISEPLTDTFTAAGRALGATAKGIWAGPFVSTESPRAVVRD